MDRRNILKAAICSPLLRLKSRGPKVPFLPTIEFLREHNKNITTFWAEYCSDGPYWIAYVHHTVYPPFSEDNLATLVWENGRWFAVSCFSADENILYKKEDKVEWPKWLRKF